MWLTRCPICPDSDQIPHRSEMTRCANKRHWHAFPGLKRNGCETLQGHHHRMGQVSPSLTPRVTRLCQAKANVASSRAPMPTGTIRKLQDMLLTTTTSGSMPAGG